MPELKRHHWALAAAILIADDEDRAIFLGDLIAGLWFGVDLPATTPS